jgi:nucleoside-diphosphate-sugar epimerase
MTEPVSVGETHVQEYQCGSRSGVVLRFGTIIGDDGLTRWMLKSTHHGRPIGTGSPRSWAHVLHTDDLGPAVVAALSAPSGVYNVGADPVRRSDLVQGFADAVGQDHGSFVGGFARRLAGKRIEPMTRSLRVTSEQFAASTGWTPRRPEFDVSWFDDVGTDAAALR